VFPALRVPWRMILGNHDYMMNAEAQIEHTHDKVHNPDGLWSMPARSYSFGYCVNSATEAVRNETATVNGALTNATVNIDFFGLDTNGVQLHVSRMYPDLPDTLAGFVEQLHTRLQGSQADWKIVFGHHPMYTQSKGHGDMGRSLRLSSSESTPVGSTASSGVGTSVNSGNSSGNDVEAPGNPSRRFFGLESVVNQGGVHAYFSGHEHVFQVSVEGALFRCGGRSWAMCGTCSVRLYWDAPYKSNEYCICGSTTRQPACTTSCAGPRARTPGTATACIGAGTKM
jgi:hypothetical protein